MMVRFHHAFIVGLALAAVCISAEQALRGSRRESDSDSDSDRITGSSDRRHEKEQQQQQQQRRNQFTFPAPVSQFIIPDPASSPNVIGGSFGGVSNYAESGIPTL